MYMKLVTTAVQAALECNRGFWNRGHITCQHLAAIVCQNFELSKIHWDKLPIHFVAVS